MKASPLCVLTGVVLAMTGTPLLAQEGTKRTWTFSWQSLRIFCAAKGLNRAQQASWLSGKTDERAELHQS